MMNREEILKIAKCKFSLDEFHMFLTPQAGNEIPSITGHGTINQDESGKLHLKILAANDPPNDFEKLLMIGNIEVKAGQIIPDTHYHKLEYHLHGENAWSSEYLTLHGMNRIPSLGRVLEAELRSLDRRATKSKKSKESKFQAIIAGEYHLPCRPLGKSIGNHIPQKIESKDLCWGGISIERLECCMEIKAQSNSVNINTQFSEKIVRAVSVALGYRLQICHIINVSNEEIVETICSFDKNLKNTYFAAPIPVSEPMHEQDFLSFIEKYCLLDDEAESVFYGFWLKMQKAWQAGVDAAELPVSISIEGVIKQSFGWLLNSDSKFNVEIELAKSKISNLSLGERFDKIIEGSFNNAMQPKPKIAIDYYIKRGKLTTNEKSSWDALRNSSAHADKLNLSLPKIQKRIQQVYSTIGMFYKLLFLRMNYSGKRIDYANAGFPVCGWTPN